MMSIKLDTRALENLLKDDDDGKIKLELQQSVLEEFSRRHIKSIINDNFFDNKMRSLRREAGEGIEKMFGEWKTTYGNKKFDLNPQIKDMIKLQAKTAVTYELDQVESHVKEIYSETAEKIKREYSKKARELNKRLTEYVDHLDSEADRLREVFMSQKVDEVIREHLKAILAESFSIGTKKETV